MVCTRPGCPRKSPYTFTLSPYNTGILQRYCGFHSRTPLKKRITQLSKSHTFSGFPVHIKVMFILHCSLLCIKALYLKKTIYVPWLKNTLLKYANHYLGLQWLTIFCWWRVWNIARATKTDRETQSEQMFLEKQDQKTCMMQGCHKPSICNQKKKKMQCLQSTI